MKRHIRRGLVLASLAVSLAAPAVAQADVLNDWNVIAQNQAIAIRPTAHGQTRGIAMVQGAVYDAVNAIAPAYKPYLLDLAKLKAQPFGSQDAAIATAAHNVLVAIVDPARVAELDTAYAATLEPIPSGATKDEGIRVGAAAAAAMLDARATDGYLAPFTFDLRADAGRWRPITATATDPDAWVGNLKPFVIESPSQFRSKGPNALTSAEYAKDFDEVKAIGSLKSTTRTADQTTAAIFWQSPPAVLYNRLARDLSAARGLDTTPEARLLAMINLAAADGAIACWNDKYHWNFWRPRAAIQEAATDGNPATVADPTWEPLFHASTATTPALVDAAVPRPSVGPRLRQRRRLPDVPRGLRHGQGRVRRRLDAVPEPASALRPLLARDEGGRDARVWGGIHFRTADVQGRDDRQEGRLLAPEALLHPGSRRAASGTRRSGRRPSRRGRRPAPAAARPARPGASRSAENATPNSDSVATIGVTTDTVPR